MTEEYEILRRNTPAGMFKINGEQEFSYPTMYNQHRFGKNMLLKKMLLKKFLEGEKLVTPTMYNRELLTQQKEFLPFQEEKLVTPTMYKKEFLPFGEEKMMYNPLTIQKEFLPFQEEKLVTPTMYNKEYLPYGEEKMMYNKMYNNMLNKEVAKEMYFNTEVPKTFEGKMMYTPYNTMPYSAYETLNKEIKY